MLRLISAAGLLLLACAQVPASASTVTGVYDGFVQRYNAGQPAPAGFPDFHGSYNPQDADPLEIEFSYDTDTSPSAIPGTTTPGYYINSLAITIGSFQTTALKPALIVFVNTNGDSGLLFLSGASSSNLPGISVLGFLVAANGLGLSSTALPDSVLYPKIGHGTVLMTLANTTDKTSVDITGAFPTYAPVPIPPTLALFVTAITGLGVIAGVHRRRPSFSA